jgi:hypothetical protein
MSERGKQGRGIVKLDDSHTHTHTRKKEKEVVEGLLLLLCEAFPHKAGACPFVGAPAFHWHLAFVFVFKESQDRCLSLSLSLIHSPSEI